MLSYSMTVGYRYRAAVLPHVPMKVRSLFGLNQYIPLSTFSSQAESGLTSVMFDIEANINDGDSRAGLDERGTQEVLEIMRRDRVKYVLLSSGVYRALTRSARISFDQARLIRHNQILARNGIDPSGARLFHARTLHVCLTIDPRDAIGLQGRDAPMNDELPTLTFLHLVIAF